MAAAVRRGVNGGGKVRGVGSGLRAAPYRPPAARPGCHQPPATPPNNTIVLLYYFINDTLVTFRVFVNCRKNLRVVFCCFSFEVVNVAL